LVFNRRLGGGVFVDVGVEREREPVRVGSEETAERGGSGDVEVESGAGDG
jgi:hypothetical protein